MSCCELWKLLEALPLSGKTWKLLRRLALFLQALAGSGEPLPTIVRSRGHLPPTFASSRELSRALANSCELSLPPRANFSQRSRGVGNLASSCKLLRTPAGSCEQDISIANKMGNTHMERDSQRDETYLAKQIDIIVFCLTNFLHKQYKPPREPWGK